jgi:putative lipoic acid-binding regulatory protein
METENENIIEFPFHLSLKSVGKDEGDYRQFVIDTIATYIKDLDVNLVTTHLSHGGKYIAVSVPFTAQNQGQLNAIYGTLKKDSRTKFMI